ncbi:unknown [Tropheryma whipplei str. Twist]|uniref:Uncharacterized protein n=1 Tax=Tropheryma whipplei (strain Twist) TaxID=203267 RepID=Q83GX9_TROWT|nr:unknown [Tropheryma whipplei str. Twist]
MHHLFLYHLFPYITYFIVDKLRLYQLPNCLFWLPNCLFWLPNLLLWLVLFWLSLGN